MKESLFICLLVLLCFYSTSGTLVDGIVTLSWSPNEPALDRFLSKNTRIRLTTLCRESSVNSSVVRQQIKDKTYKTDKENPNAKIHITGRIGRVLRCLPLQSDPFLTNNQIRSNSKDHDEERAALASFYNRLWSEMEHRTFAAHLNSCEHDSELVIDEYSEIIPPTISADQSVKDREEEQSNCLVSH